MIGSEKGLLETKKFMRNALLWVNNFDVSDELNNSEV